MAVTAGDERAGAPSPPRFYSVAEVAEILGMAPVTLYRAIRAGQFPAVRIRGRLIVPAKVVEAIADTAAAEAIAAHEDDLPQWVHVPNPSQPGRS
jgi:excisionase family DNA binding protein